MKAYTLGLYEKAMPKELNWKEKLETADAAVLKTEKLPATQPFCSFLSILIIAPMEKH